MEAMDWTWGFTWMACAFVCAGIAQRKGRNMLIWFGIGLGTSLIGLAVAWWVSPLEGSEAEK